MHFVNLSPSLPLSPLCACVLDKNIKMNHKAIPLNIHNNNKNNNDNNDWMYCFVIFLLSLYVCMCVCVQCSYHIVCLLFLLPSLEIYRVHFIIHIIIIIGREASIYQSVSQSFTSISSPTISSILSMSLFSHTLCLCIYHSKHKYTKQHFLLRHRMLRILPRLYHSYHQWFLVLLFVVWLNEHTQKKNGKRRVVQKNKL